MGSIHAIEHAMKSLFPLLALSNRTDVGGICYPLHPQLRKGAIFIYDYYPGGIGLAEKGFSVLDQLLDMSLELVENCDCERAVPPASLSHLRCWQRASRQSRLRAPAQSADRT